MIAREAAENPDNLKNAPLKTPVRRLDEATAARKPGYQLFPAPWCNTQANPEKPVEYLQGFNKLNPAIFPVVST